MLILLHAVEKSLYSLRGTLPKGFVSEPLRAAEGHHAWACVSKAYCLHSHVWSYCLHSFFARELRRCSTHLFLLLTSFADKSFADINGILSMVTPIMARSRFR